MGIYPAFKAPTSARLVRTASMYTSQSVSVTDMHTGGEPLRVVERVTPDPGLAGDTILAKRRDLRDRCDWLRRFVVFEPRGHSDMYAAYVVRPSCHPEADLSVLFMHNEGYSTMCGHAVIALAKYAVVKGLVVATPPSTQVNIECPCGLVRATYHHGDADSPDSASFISVPAYNFDTYRDFQIDIEGAPASINFDIAYGGAFYIILPEGELGMNAATDPVDLVVRRCQELKRLVSQRVRLTHPESPDLAFIYGVIVTDGRDAQQGETANLCVFADGEVDRSPTGSGVTARLALMSARGQAGLDGAWRVFRNSKTNSVMRGRLAAACPDYPVPGAVRVEVAGSAYVTGESTLTAESGDPMLPGFRVM